MDDAAHLTNLEPAGVALRTSWRASSPEGERWFGTDDGLHVFAETGAKAVSSHACPAWKIVIPREGSVTTSLSPHTKVGSPHGVLITPNTQNVSETDAGYIALFIDGWRTTTSHKPGCVELDAATADRIQHALRSQDGLDLVSARQELADLLGLHIVHDRFTDAIQELNQTMTLTSVSESLALSPSRTRAIVHARAGAPLSTIRLWNRLGQVVARLPDLATAAAGAAEAGFADQSHLTRVAKTQLGRTPSSLFGSV